MVRGWRGFTAALFSKAKREAVRSRNALLGAAIAYLAVRYLQVSPSWLWMLAGAWLGHQIEPDPQRR